MTPMAFAWRSLTRDRARMVLGVSGIAAVGALLLDMLLLSRGILVSFSDILTSTGYDVRVTATAALPGLGAPIEDALVLAERIRRLPEVEEVVAVRLGRATTVAPGGATQPVSFVACSSRRRGEWTVVRGSDVAEALPGGLPEAVVNARLARDLRLEPGATLTLKPRAGVSVALRVVGIAGFPFDAHDELTVGMDFDGLRLLVPSEGAGKADLLLVASRLGTGTGHGTGRGADSAVAAIGRALPGVNVFSIADLLARLSRRDFSYFRQISFVLASITSFFAFLLVATLLSVSVNQRLGEVAALRAIGFSRRRVAQDLLAEAALLVGIGGIIAFPLGLLLARSLDAILRQIPGLPERLHFFVLEPRTVLLHGALLALSGILAAVYPVAVATRLPIAATLRQEVVS